MGRVMETVLVLAIVGGLLWYASSRASTAVPASSSVAGAGTSGGTTATGTSANGAGSGAPTLPSGSVLPPPPNVLPPPIPIQTGVPIQTAGHLAGLYSLLQQSIVPGSTFTADFWNSRLSVAWNQFIFATGPAQVMAPPSIDPMTVFAPLYPGYDGTQTMTLETYWTAVKPYLQANYGLSGYRRWAV
jgi:hypothetical protein